MAADGARGGGDGEELLLRAVEDGVGSEGGVGLCVGERPWRLNFDGFRRPEAHQEKPERGLQDCLGVLGKRRTQPLGILVFASVMATLGLQIILESTRSLVSDDHFFDVITNVIGLVAALLSDYVQGWIDPVATTMSRWILSFHVTCPERPMISAWPSKRNWSSCPKSSGPLSTSTMIHSLTELR